MNTRVVVFLISLIIYKACADHQQDAWQEPNAWERHSPSVFTPNTCPVCDAVEDGEIALFLYKKLVTNLFNQKTLKKNEYTGQLERAIQFSVSPAQLAIIENSVDIRDLDTVISSILGAAKIPKSATGNKEGSGFIWLLGDIAKDCWQLLMIILSNSEGRFAFFALGVVLLIWFIHKRYNKNIIYIVGVGFLLFGYFFTYLECNRKLEADKIIAFTKESAPEDGGWFRKAFNLVFRKTSQDQQISNIQRQSKISLPFCRPDHVLMMYINEMFLNQFQLIIEKCVEMSISFKDKIPFPYNIAAMLSLPFLFMGIIKLIFKHILSPVAWYKAMHTYKNQQHQPQQEPQVDRLSGDNLRKFLEFVNLNDRPKVEQNLPPSGVQDIIEPHNAAALENKADNSFGDDNVVITEDSFEIKSHIECKASVESKDSVENKDNVENRDSIESNNIVEDKVKRRRKLKMFSF